MRHVPPRRRSGERPAPADTAKKELHMGKGNKVRKKEVKKPKQDKDKKAAAKK